MGDLIVFLVFSLIVGFATINYKLN